jgi:phytoene dehydrogenase-like protein
LISVCRQERQSILPFYDLLTAPASQFLNKWFESDILKATLATDAIIGSMTSPYAQGSSYVLLHHIMGSIEGHEGSWAYVRGGMGAITQALAKSAEEKGVKIFTDSEITSILHSNGHVRGI